MFAISSAALGYMLAIFSNEKIPVEKVATFPFVFGAAAFAISLLCGILLVFNRLDAFRETCEIIKLRDKEDRSESLDEKRDENDATDSWTRLYFKTQFLSFVTGGICFVLHALISNWERARIVFDRVF
jgi:hypothetical protein